MHRAARTAPGTAGRAALLAAVVLALLTALCTAGPPGDTGSTPAVGPASSSSYGDAGDGGADCARAVQAGARTAAHGEQPTPLTCAPGTGPRTAPGPAWPIAPAPYISSSEQHTSHDRGRAPPAASGI